MRDGRILLDRYSYTGPIHHRFISRKDESNINIKRNIFRIDLMEDLIADACHILAASGSLSGQ